MEGTISNNFKLTSVLEPIVKEVVELQKQGKPLSELQQYTISAVQKHSRMNPKDRMKIVRTTLQQTDTHQLIKYLYNSLLTFEGYGSIRNKPIVYRSKPASQTEQTED